MQVILMIENVNACSQDKGQTKAMFGEPGLV
jgi:hypothetical protein